MSYIQVMEGNFCRVVGSIRQTQDRRHVMAFRVAKLTSANEITTHLLETQWVRMKLLHMKKKMVSWLAQCKYNIVSYAKCLNEFFLAKRVNHSALHRRLQVEWPDH